MEARHREIAVEEEAEAGQRRAQHQRSHGGEESGEFRYAGPLDGKPHSVGDGTVTLKRVDPFTIGRRVEMDRNPGSPVIT